LHACLRPKPCAIWRGCIGVKTLYIEPSSPWENSYNESFNLKLRDGLLNGEIDLLLAEGSGGF
jgi:putative transposase